jgi:2-hydroxychromene-2-carboxylate isomerase
VSGAGSSGPLVVAIDFRQPQSYLAIGPTTKLAASLGVEIDWQPMTARPLQASREETTGDDRGARHRRFRARYLERDLQRYAEAPGLELGDLHRWPDSSVAGMGLLWAKKHAARAGGAKIVDAYVHRVFDGYWGGRFPLDDAGSIRAVLDTLGAAAAAFDPASLRAEYDSVLEHWRTAGLVEAPAYVLGEEIFIGRAHLPMIEWLITGKAGPAPV